MRDMDLKINILEDIKGFIEEGELSFLIGAGFSRNVNKDVYPLWGGLLKDAIWKLFGNKDRARQEKKIVDSAVKEYGYLAIASMIVKKAGYHEAIDTYIESKTPYIKTVSGKPVLLLNGKPLPNPVTPDCHQLLKNLDIQNIYTFNYDNALEFFMGDEAKQALENKIRKTESKLEELQKTIIELKQQEILLNEKLAGFSQTDNKTSLEGVVENKEGDASNVEELKKELDELQKKKSKNKADLDEQKAGLELDKWNLRTYYNVVKDSYEISLSAKRKSIYKIHGCLRENTDDEYGFDGDSHTQYIITQEDYDTYNEKHGAFVNMMRIDLLRNRFCIIGVSGGDANFLAWINWVKDVLDKTKDRARQGDGKQHKSYFIYSGNDDMPMDLVLMLKNHFIEPVILKEIFPKSKNDEQRIKLFLEYVQPFVSKDALRFSDLWNEVIIPGQSSHPAKRVGDGVGDDLLRLSSFYKFNGPHSMAHYKATEVQFTARYFLRDGATKQERKTYAAAVKSSLMPIDVTCRKDDFVQMDKETDKELKGVFRNAARRAVLLQNIQGRFKKLVEEDVYSGILHDLYNFRFPTPDKVDGITLNSGIDFVRHFSLLHLLKAEITNHTKCQPSDFSSPQELVLAAEWLKYIGYNDPVLYNKTEEYKHRGRLLSLYDYCQAYLDAMRHKEEISTYGDVSETVYLDKYTLDVTNGAVLLNSFVELGICFGGHTMLSDNEWLEIVRALRQRYPSALIFYTIARNSNNKVIKLVAQEMMYDDISRQMLPAVLINILNSLVLETTPTYLKGKMAQFASEILPAVGPKRWSKLFVANAEKILDIASRYNRNLDLSKSMYGLVAKALGYVSANDLRLRLLNRVLEDMDLDDDFGSYYNTLVIAARNNLKPSDFTPIVDKFIGFIEKTENKHNQQANFVIMNLLLLLDKEHKQKVLKLVENRALRDAYLIGAYALYIKDFPELVVSFTEYFLKREDLWRSGITKEGVRLSGNTIEVSQIDKLLHFNDEQVAIIFNDMSITIEKIDKFFQKKNQVRDDKSWMAPENSFRELVMDMRLFEHRRQKLLSRFDGFDETHDALMRVYERCFFGKDIYQLIADDEIYRAIRRLMTEVELNGINKYRSEYEQILGRIIAKDTKELVIAFHHITWAMNQYKSFFIRIGFKKLFVAILKVYQPYFDITNGESQPWDLIGCQKEEAEKALVSISKTIGKWGTKDDFWSQYHRVFYVK